MNLYEHALSWHNSAKVLVESGHYQQGIYHCCLAGKLYCKSVLNMAEHNSDLEISHDVIGIYNAISKKYGKDPLVTDAIKFVRKYFNEARYPSTQIDFTEKLALEFVGYADIIKDYVDQKCGVTAEELAEHFKKRL